MQQFIWADDLGTVRITWDGRDGFTAYAIATMEVVEEFTVEGAYDLGSACAICAKWWRDHGRALPTVGDLARSTLRDAYDQREK